MHEEIERKFLITAGDWREAADAGVQIRQGYLCNGAGLSVRVRLTGNTAYLTIKLAAGYATRQEFEYSVPAEDARILLERRCSDSVVEKTRFRVGHGGHQWEVDVFEGANAGLQVAEVELEAIDQPVSLPDWVGEEVTGDSRYLNASLSKHPFREWTGS